MVSYEQATLDLTPFDLDDLTPECFPEMDFSYLEWKLVHSTNDERLEAGLDHICSVPRAVVGFAAYKFFKWGTFPHASGEMMIFHDKKQRVNPMLVRKIVGRCIILNANVTVLSTYKVKLEVTYLSGTVAFEKNFNTRDHWPVVRLRAVILKELISQGKASDTSKIHLIPDGATAPARGNAWLWPHPRPNGRVAVRRRPAAAGSMNIRQALFHN